MTIVGDERDVLMRAAIGWIEWRCYHCGNSGAGFMPEEHASGACEATRRTPRLVPEVARDAQYTVVAILHGATHFMDGGGI